MAEKTPNIFNKPIPLSNWRLKFYVIYYIGGYPKEAVAIVEARTRQQARQMYQKMLCTDRDMEAKDCPATYALELPTVREVYIIFQELDS